MTDAPGLLARGEFRERDHVYDRPDAPQHGHVAGGRDARQEQKQQRDEGKDRDPDLARPQQRRHGGGRTHG
jgi:hypothetical protein